MPESREVLPSRESDKERNARYARARKALSEPSLESVRMREHMLTEYGQDKCGHCGYHSGALHFAVLSGDHEGVWCMHTEGHEIMFDMTPWRPQMAWFLPEGEWRWGWHCSCGAPEMTTCGSEIGVKTFAAEHIDSVLAELTARSVG